MNRLTDKDRFGAFISLGDASAGEWTLAGKFERRLYGDAANRLAAYEDTDLTPEEVMQLRAEQENKPLTCEGCEYRKHEGFDYENCIRCNRHWPDRYRSKPKEEV